MTIGGSITMHDVGDTTLAASPDSLDLAGKHFISMASVY